MAAHLEIDRLFARPALSWKAGALRVILPLCTLEIGPFTGTVLRRLTLHNIIQCHLAVLSEAAPLLIANRLTLRPAMPYRKTFTQGTLGAATACRQGHHQHAVARRGNHGFLLSLVAGPGAVTSNVGTGHISEHAKPLASVSLAPNWSILAEVPRQTAAPTSGALAFLALKPAPVYPQRKQSAVISSTGTKADDIRMFHIIFLVTL